MKKNLAIIAGGYSGEYKVSLKSGKALLSWFQEALLQGISDYTPYLVVIDKNTWSVNMGDKESLPIDRTDFSFMLNGVKQDFDFIYITIHGTPGEDGIIQGYFDMLALPYNTGSVASESLTFNKFYCNRYLSTFNNIRVAKSIRLKAPINNQEQAEEIVQALGLPIFVKPNTGGSSIATTKIKQAQELQEAVNLALSEAPEVMIEGFIKGTEVTCGCYRDLSLSNTCDSDNIKALPVTEVVTNNPFFDYNAKYKGEVEEITPARISDELTELIQKLTKEIYQRVDAQGVIRVDYIIEDDGYPTLLEVNTTPGMTQTSFIPQQVHAEGMSMPEFLLKIIQK